MYTHACVRNVAKNGNTAGQLAQQVFLSRLLPRSALHYITKLITNVLALCVVWATTTIEMKVVSTQWGGSVVVGGGG